MKFKKLNENDDRACEDPKRDVEIFQENIKGTYGEFRKKHRDIVDPLRSRELDTFSRVGQSRAGTRGDGKSEAYSRIDAEVQALKERIGQARGVRDLLDDLGNADRKAITHRDFYAAQEEDSEYDDEDGSWDDSDDLFDLDAKSDNDDWKLTGKQPKKPGKDKRQLYQNQLRKTLGGRK